MIISAEKIIKTNLIFECFEKTFSYLRFDVISDGNLEDH